MVTPPLGSLASANSSCICSSTIYRGGAGTSEAVANLATLAQQLSSPNDPVSCPSSKLVAVMGDICY